MVDKPINIIVPEYSIKKNIRLNSRETALIIVDMQNDFVDKRGALYVDGSEKIVPRIKILLDRAREKNVLIIYTMDTHLENDMEFTIWPKHCVENTWGWRIVDDLKPAKDDIIIRKLRYDAFFGTPLDHILRLNNIKDIVICGVVANICVLHTAGSAALHGYRVIYPIDATVALTDFDYYLSIRQISFLYRGVITTTDEIHFE